MNIEFVEEGEEVAEVKLEDANAAIANALRRSMMVRVDTLAVKHVDVIRNESALFNEVLAHRIGMVPLNIPDNMEEDDEIHLSVKKEGPTTVKAKHLVPENDEADAVNPEAIIVDLKEGQELKAEAKAVLNTGSEHTKHQGGTIGYEKIGEGDYLFRVESTSAYSNRELLEEAINSVQRDLDQAEQLI